MCVISLKVILQIWQTQLIELSCYTPRDIFHSITSLGVPLFEVVKSLPMSGLKSPLGEGGFRTSVPEPTSCFCMSNSALGMLLGSAKVWPRTLMNCLVRPWYGRVLDDVRFWGRCWWCWWRFACIENSPIWVMFGYGCAFAWGLKKSPFW